MKKTLLIAFILFLLLPTLIFSAKEKSYSLKVGMVVANTDPMFLGAMEFKKNVEKRTNGKIKIEVYPSSQLGDTQVMMEQVKAGANIAVITDAARLAEFVKPIGILGAPYIVENYKEAKKLVTSTMFKKWTDELAEKNNYRVLSFNWYQGARHLWTNKPAKVPSDLNGLRLRTPGATVWTETVRALGGVPTALAFAEVYPGIQQKVIDGLECQIPAAYDAHLYEVLKYMTKTAHFQLITPLVCSESWFQRLPKMYQTIVLDEALKAGDYASQKTEDLLKGYEDNMKKAGLIITDIDTTPFRKSCEGVYDKIEGYRDLKNQINKLLGKK